MSQNKLQEGDGSFLPGQNSLLDPTQLPPGYYARGMNVVNRGGIIQCRPGYQCLFVLPEGNQQGGYFFTPKLGNPVFVFGVSGNLYVSEAPYKEYRQLTGVQFSPEARELFFEQVEQSFVYNPDGSIRLIDVRALLVIQDGGTAPAAVFDGTRAEHQRGPNAIPSGGPMEWVGDRLWVARNAEIFASDLANPLLFTEAIYFVTSKAFSIPGRCVALSKTPGTLSPQLLAFTERSVTLFQAGIRNRAAWLTTPDFQKDDVFPGIGATSARSVFTLHGKLWWFSSHGLTNMDAAAQANVTSALPYVDSEMTDSKSRLSPDLTGVACMAYENYLLVSVPHGDLYNTHTWVLDNAPLQQAVTPPAWNSFWTGTRPVQWLAEEVDGQKRCFHISYDYDGQSRLWEAFTPDRRDDGCPITWWFESRALNLGAPGKNKEFRYADVFLSEIDGTVDIAVFWAGSHRGRYKRILTKRLNAGRGSIRAGEEIQTTTSLFALKKQSRSLRTQDGRALALKETLPSCGVESPNGEFKDEAFQIIVVGSGPAAVRGFIVYAEPPRNDDDAGRVEVDETIEKFVRFDGAAAHEAENFGEAQTAFEEDVAVFTSVRTATVSQDEFTEIGTGSAESIISQENADLIASTIALRKASEQMEEALPLIVSLGEMANYIE